MTLDKRTKELMNRFNMTERQARVKVLFERGLMKSDIIEVMPDGSEREVIGDSLEDVITDKD